MNTTDNIKTKLFQLGGLFPPVGHFERIEKYKKNKKIFKGHHCEAFKGVSSGKAKDLLYVSVNLAGIICKKSADFLFGEEVKILAGKGEHTKEQEALDRLYSSNDLNIMLYENALNNSYAGDSFVKVRYGQEWGGELPSELDEFRTIIENVNPEHVYPEVMDWDKSKIKAYHIAVPVFNDDTEQWILNIESHYAGKIIYNKFSLVPLHYNMDGEVTRFEIDGYIENSASTVHTGVSIPLVVHIPNFSTAGEWEGLDDLSEIHPLLDEINNRLSQISDILDKHSNPAMAVPSGLLSEDEDGNAQFRVAVDKVFEVMGKDDVIPQYITWNGQLIEAFQELDRLVNMVLTVTEIPAVALGMGDSGTSGSSGLAIKWRMNSLLAKVNRKKQYYAKGLKQVLFIAQKLEEALDINDYAITVPVLHFQDGLPKDDMEQATIMNMRTGGAKTLSQKSAIMQLNNFTEEQAEAELERIKEEEESSTEISDAGFLNPDENSDFSVLDSEEKKE